MKRPLALLSLIMLAACGGGGGGGSLPSIAPSSHPVNQGGGPPATPTPAASPTPASPSTPVSSPPPASTPTPLITSAPTSQPTTVPTAAPSTSPAAVRFTATLPLNDSQNFSHDPSLSPAFSFSVRLLSVNGSPVQSVTTRQTTCSSTSCQVNITAPAGADTFAMAYAVNAQAITNGPEPIAYNANFSLNVVPNVTNASSIMLTAVPSFYELDAIGNSPWSTQMPLRLRLADAASPCTPALVSFNDCGLSAFIQGVYLQPLTLTDTDASGQTALVLNGGTPSRTVRVTRSSDTVSLSIRSGANIAQAYVTPSSPTFNAAEFTGAFNPITLQPWVTQDPNGLGFTCAGGSCQTTGPGGITIQ